MKYIVNQDYSETLWWKVEANSPEEAIKKLQAACENGDELYDTYRVQMNDEGELYILNN
jgi:hypothetical protein